MIGKYASWAAIVLSAFLIVATGAWLYIETTWRASVITDDPAGAFAHRSIGLEAFPVKYAAVMQTLSADSFFAKDATGDIFGDFGFIPNPKGAALTCASNIADWAPVGLGVSGYIPVKAIQTRTQFVGLTCAACHTAQLRMPDGSRGPIVEGLGNQELDVIAWSDGVRNAILDPKLTSAAIIEAYDEQCAAFDEASGAADSWVARQIDSVIIGAWLDGFRDSVKTDLAKYGLPHPGANIRDPKLIPAGPGRTRPFRSVVRVALDLPGADNIAMSKIPAVWEQGTDLRAWSQYDGSIRSPEARSLIAAYASGASVLALAQPDIAANIKGAAKHTETLTPNVNYADLFGPLDADAVARGREAYMAHCNSCHGHRDESGAWSLAGADRIHSITPVAEIGTDEKRVTFRYAFMLPDALYTTFPQWDEDRKAQERRLEILTTSAQENGEPAKAAFWLGQLDKLNHAAREHRLGHALGFARDDIRAGNEVTGVVGYFNNPIPGAWLRAPYLHNGSVPTMAQLLHLEPRPSRFCRGANPYDPDALGLKAPTGPCPPEMAFRYDTAAPGNSAAGHDYPYAPDQAGAHEAELRDLLEYLKTL
ncbi:MAG: di-heme-cytochrome C peroxidase [Pikeienuella sp.]